MLVGDQVWHEIELPDLDPADWRSAAEAMGVGLYAMFSRHPWLVQAFGTYLFYGAGKARYDDHSLAIYEAAGFPDDQADQAAAAVFTFVLGSVLGASATTTLAKRLSRDGGDAPALIADTMAAARDVALQFPRLRRRLDAPAARQYAAAPDQTFELGLRALIDGLQAQLAAHSSAGSGRDAHPARR